jgi:hypothetical protein
MKFHHPGRRRSSLPITPVVLVSHNISSEIPVVSKNSKLERGSYTIRHPGKDEQSTEEQNQQHNQRPHTWGHRVSTVISRPALAIFTAWCKIWVMSLSLSLTLF